MALKPSNLLFLFFVLSFYIKMGITVCSDGSKSLEWFIEINCMQISFLNCSKGSSAVSDWLYFKIFNIQQEKDIQLQKPKQSKKPPKLHMLEWQRAQLQELTRSTHNRSGSGTYNECFCRLSYTMSVGLL